uniref:Saposin B-type domain-containing protein n=1 Tax=Steinernema glaseri TaxID=37863 RepID=A0A1I7XXK9_9BILA
MKKEIVATFCEVCITAMIGVVYDLVQFKHLLLHQVEPRCDRLFPHDEVLQRHCVETISKEITRLLDRAEMGLNPNKICSKFRFCFEDDGTY